MEVYLEVDANNVSDLQEMGFNVGIGDELTCNARYENNPADPCVGIMYAACDVYAVEHNDDDITRFFDLDELSEQAAEQEEAMLDNARCDAAEDRWKEDRCHAF